MSLIYLRDPGWRRASFSMPDFRGHMYPSFIWSWILGPCRGNLLAPSNPRHGRVFPRVAKRSDCRHRPSLPQICSLPLLSLLSRKHIKNANTSKRVQGTPIQTCRIPKKGHHFDERTTPRFGHIWKDIPRSDLPPTPTGHRVGRRGGSLNIRSNIRRRTLGPNP